MLLLVLQTQHDSRPRKPKKGNSPDASPMVQQRGQHNTQGPRTCTPQTTKSSVAQAGNRTALKSIRHPLQEPQQASCCCCCISTPTAAGCALKVHATQHAPKDTRYGNTKPALDPPQNSRSCTKAAIPAEQPRCCVAADNAMRSQGVPQKGKQVAHGVLGRCRHLVSQHDGFRRTACGTNKQGCKPRPVNETQHPA